MRLGWRAKRISHSYVSWSEIKSTKTRANWLAIIKTQNWLNSGYKNYLLRCVWLQCLEMWKKTGIGRSFWLNKSMGVKLPPRICLGFSIVLLLSVVILWFAWNMTCNIDTPGSILLENRTVGEEDGWIGDRVAVDIYYEVSSILAIILLV